MDEYPYSAVGVVMINNIEVGNIKLRCHGTGCLIGPNLVLTVFHNCTPLKQKKEMEIEFIPAPIQKRGGRGFKVAKKYLPEQAWQMY